MSSLLKQISAIAHSGKFDTLLDGVEIKLPTGEIITLRIGKTMRSMRPQGLRFCKYSFVTEVHAGEYTGCGFGEDDSKILSLQKSIAEGCERAIYFALKGTSHGTLNTNGWAAHLNIEEARQSAINELIERDAVLVHWLSHQPMQVVDQSKAPSEIKSWVMDELSLSNEFTGLRILVSSLGFLPVVTTVLLKNNFHGVSEGFKINVAHNTSRRFV